MRRGWIAFVVVGSVSFTSAARADFVTRDAGAKNEARDLARSIKEQAQTLSTQDCPAACRALASMTRSVDRLCAIDPGPTCQDARATMNDAAQRVRSACGDCPAPLSNDETSKTTTAAPAPEPPPNAPAPSKREPKDYEEKPTAVGASDHAPAAEKRSGGCAGCTQSSRTAGDGLTPLAWLGFLVAFAVRSRNPRRRR